MVIDCDCGTKTVIKGMEPLFCKKCGRKPIFRYTENGVYRFEGTFLSTGRQIIKERRADFQMFKRLLFQIRDEAISEESYLYFLAGYFGVIPTSEDLAIPKEGTFKLREQQNK